MISSKNQTVFLSGTSEVMDITNNLFSELQKLDFKPTWYKKRFETNNLDAIEECLKNVEKSDRYILIIGRTYGSIYPKTGNSITEEEFKTALILNKPVLVFIKSEVYHQFKIFESLKRKSERFEISSNDLKSFGFDADIGVYEFILRVVNKRYHGIRKIPWMSEFNDIEDIISVVKDKWISKEFSYQISKISILGIQNAGKTAIIYSIFKNFLNYEGIVRNLRPTKGVERQHLKVLDHDINHFDFGGQRRYRDMYLRKPENFFLLTDIIFYVIDLQETLWYVESLDYFKEIIKKLKDVLIKNLWDVPPIIVMLHKYDPDLPKEKKEKIDEQVVLLKYSFREHAEGFDLFFFKTSIYDVSTIIECYSSALSLLFDKTKLIPCIFSEISKNQDILIMALFDSSGIIIGEYYLPSVHLSDKNKIYEFYLKVERRIKNEDRAKFRFSDAFKNGTPFSGVIEIIRIGQLHFYLLIITEGEFPQVEQKLKNKIENARPKIEEIISKIIPFELEN